MSFVISGRSAGRTRQALAASAIALFCVMSSACGASRNPQAGRAETVAPAQTRAPAAPAPATKLVNANEVLSLSGLGTFEGRCPRGARAWTLRFVVTAGATDTFSYAVGNGVRRTVNVEPSQSVAIHLVPYAARTHEPADRFVPPIGQGRGVATAVSVPTTAPLHALIYQGTEPQTLRADVDLALSTIGGETGQCILVGSTVHAYTYPNG